MARETQRRHKRRRLRNWGIFTGTLVLILLSVFLVYRRPALAVYRNTVFGKNAFLEAQHALLAQEYGTASQRLTEAVDHFQTALDGSEGLQSLHWVPIVGKQIIAVENVLRVGVETGNAALSLSKMAERVTAPIQSDGPVNFASITKEQKRQVLQLVSESEPDIQGAKAEIDLAVYYLDQIPAHGLIGPVASGVRELRDQLPAIQDALNRALPAARVMPSIAGYPSAKKYLFLLQNNSELRPTGGFIGTYGLLEVKDGEIADFRTDNIYNLDLPVKDTLDITPPKPLQKYLSADKWFLRDANWSPDFPTSAKEALHFYDLETQAKQNLDGVIAVTPTFIASLLQVTGEISVGGFTFTADNLVDTLEYQTQQGFLREGIPESERKEIIGLLAQELFNRLLALPQEQWTTLWSILERDTLQKQIEMYMVDEAPQALIQQLQWGGEVTQSDGDQLLVVDANLASLKTDPVVDRSISYSVRLENDALIANLTVHYKHNGNFDWKTTRYRTYTRVYVPEGAELIAASGFMRNDKTKGGGEAQPEVSSELQHTVFGGFISIEPQEEGTLTLQYKLPERLAEKFRNGTYQLNAQKQAGARAHQFDLDVSTPGSIQSHSPIEGARLQGDQYILSTPLSHDYEVSLTFGQ